MRFLFKIFSVLIGLICIFVIFQSTDVNSVLNVFQSLDLKVFIIVLPIICLNLLLRSYRWQAMIIGADTKRTYPYFSAISIGYLANNILPARGGDLVRVYSLSVQQGIRKIQSFSTVLVERVCDLFVACFLLGWVSLSLEVPVWLMTGAMMIGLFAATGFFALLIVTYYGSPLAARVERILKKVLPGMADWIMSQVAGFSTGIKPMGRVSVACKFIWYTFLLWLAEFSVAYLMASYFSLNLNSEQVILIMMFSVFASLVPALPGQLGAFELAVITGLELFGEIGPNAIGFAISWHVTLLLTTSSIGAIVLLLQRNALVRSKLR